MTTSLPKLVSEGFDSYNKVTLLDNITLLPILYREDQDIIVLRIIETEIEEAFPELDPKKKYIKKKQ